MNSKNKNNKQQKQRAAALGTCLTLFLEKRRAEGPTQQLTQEMAESMMKHKEQFAENWKNSHKIIDESSAETKCSLHKKQKITMTN